MSKYKVSVYETTTYLVPVEADSKDEAYDIAWEWVSEGKASMFEENATLESLDCEEIV